MCSVSFDYCMFVLLVLLPITASDYIFDILKSFILLEKETGIAGTTQPEPQNGNSHDSPNKNIIMLYILHRILF